MASTMTSGDINLFMSGASRHAQATADQHEHELSVAIIGAKIWKPLSEEKVIVSVLIEGVMSFYFSLLKRYEDQLNSQATSMSVHGCHVK